MNASRIIQKTNFEKVDIIPCDLSLGTVEAEFILDPDSQYILQNKLEEARANYDLIILDTPPNLGIFTRMALVASDYAIIPIECSAYGVRSTLFLLRLINKIKNRANPAITILGFIINKIDVRRTIEQTYLAKSEKQIRNKSLPDRDKELSQIPRSRNTGKTNQSLPAKIRTGRSLPEPVQGNPTTSPTTSK